MRTTDSRTGGGLSLIELLISIAIVAILAGTALPMAEGYAKSAKESELKRNLFDLRAAIDRYYADAHAKSPAAPEATKYPASLEELVARKYLRSIPADPLTGRADYELIHYVDLPKPQGLFDVKSSARKLSSTGEFYSAW